MKRASSPNLHIAELCPACGLCCNGVLFRDVELRSGDDALRLTRLGLALREKGRQLAFTQPCSCLEGGLCQIYPDRPRRCRTFECGVLKGVIAGDLSAEAGLKLVRQAQAQAERVRGLLRQLGNSAETQPLSRRFASVMQQPIDLSAGDEMADLRAALLLEVESLMQFLESKFLMAPGKATDVQ